MKGLAWQALTVPSFIIFPRPSGFTLPPLGPLTITLHCTYHSIEFCCRRASRYRGGRFRAAERVVVQERRRVRPSDVNFICKIVACFSYAVYQRPLFCELFLMGMMGTSWSN